MRGRGGGVKEEQEDLPPTKKNEGSVGDGAAGDGGGSAWCPETLQRRHTTEPR